MFLPGNISQNVRFQNDKKYDEGKRPVSVPGIVALITDEIRILCGVNIVKAESEGGLSRRFRIQLILWC